MQGCICCQYVLLHLDTDHGNNLYVDLDPALDIISSLFLVLAWPLLSFPLEHGEVCVGHLGAARQPAALRLQLLGHCAHVVALHAAAAADDAHAELVRRPRELGRLPARDLARLERCRGGIVATEYNSSSPLTVRILGQRGPAVVPRVRSPVAQGLGHQVHPRHSCGGHEVSLGQPSVPVHLPPPALPSSARGSRGR